MFEKLVGVLLENKTFRFSQHQTLYMYCIFARSTFFNVCGLNVARLAGFLNSNYSVPAPEP